MIKYRLPKKDDSTLISFLNRNNLSLEDVKKVPIISKPDTYELECHKNVNRYVHLYGGKQSIGSYLLICCDTGDLHIIRHSVLETYKGDVIDITPFSDNRKYNVFINLDIMEKHLIYKETEKELYVVGSFNNDMEDETFDDMDF